MAKTKGKAKIAASNAPSKVEEVPSNENFVESVETEEAATTMILDKSEVVVKKDETDDGSDSEGVEEPEEIENGLDESEEVGGTEKNEDGFYESKEVVETEEIKDGIDASEDTNKIEETKEDPDEGDEEEKSIDGKVEPVGTDGHESENVEGRDMTGDVKDNGKGENVSGKKGKRMRRRKKKGAAAATASNDANKKDTSAAAKDVKMTGLIFMCNAKTKSECFSHKVFGLPEGKKEMVAKVYKGMRLFLYDIDLKLMYGIYKAASPGGYNIEPEAFKSAFPSQVRFTVLKDCLPLPEEKFKLAIKENYYGRNRFNCQLSSEQVKKLCELFQNAVQTPKKTEGEVTPKKTGEVIRAEQEPNSSSRGRKRERRGGEASRAEQGRGSPSRGQKRPRRGREVVRADQGRTSSRGRGRGQNTSRREMTRHDNSISRGRDMYARRGAYVSPPPRLVAPLLPPAPYAYVQPVDDYYYRREPPLLDPRDHRVAHQETRTYEPLGYREPYSMYMEPLSREPVGREALYREHAPYTVAANQVSSTYAAAYDPLGTHYRY